MPTVNLGLTIPAGLADGQVADATQITPLFNTLNAMSLPNNLFVFIPGFVDDNLYTVATGASQDWAFSAPQAKSLFCVIPFSWSGAGASPTVQFRINATTITAAGNMTLTNNATGAGLFVLFFGGKDTDVPRSFMGLGMESNALGTARIVGANTDLPAADTTSVGVLAGGATVTFKFKHVRFWAEG